MCVHSWANSGTSDEMKLPFQKYLPADPQNITYRLAFLTFMVAAILGCLILLSIWAGNTLAMITTIARFERTHTVSRLEAKVSLLQYLESRDLTAKKNFYRSMGATQSYNKVFSRLLEMRETKSRDEFASILLNTYAEADEHTSRVIVNRIGMLHWHPIVKELVEYAHKANIEGEHIITLATRVMAERDPTVQKTIMAKIQQAENKFIEYEHSFSRRCGDLAYIISQYVSYISLVILILSVGFTGLVSYLIAYALLRQAADYSKELEKSRERLALVIKGSSDAPWDWNMISGEIYYSPQWYKQLGYTPNDILNQAELWKQIIHPDDYDMANDVLEVALTSGFESYEVEYRLQHKDGHYIPLLSRGFISRDESDRPIRITGTNMDLSERKKMEEELRKNVEFLDKVIESAALSTWISDEQGTAIRANPACLKFFGATEEEIIGKYNMLQDSVIRKKGLMAEVEKVFETGEPANIVINYDFGAVDHVEVKNAARKVVNTIFTPIKNSEGTITNVIVQSIDLTEIRKIEKELLQSRKMESIGNLAGGIAHDFNNILSAILGFTELAMEDSEVGSTQYDSMKEVYVAGKRAKELVNQILVFARQTDDEKVPVRVDRVIRDTLKLLRPSTPTTIDIVPTIKSAVSVYANPSQLQQVVMNLCTNAVHAMQKDGGVLEIRLQDLSAEEAAPLQEDEAQSVRYVELTVADTGTGIGPDILESIFEPYFTTKGVGEGTGMGLAMVKSIVEGCKGKITVKSELAKYTSFTIQLPITEGQTVQEVQSPVTDISGTEHILIVDDEPAIVRMAEKLLRGLGYQVTTADGSLEALALFQKNVQEIDLVITDMTMPVMTGDVLAMEIRKIDQAIPIVLCTGFSEKISEEEALSIGIDAFVLKPFSKAELSGKVRLALDKQI